MPKGEQRSNKMIKKPKKATVLANAPAAPSTRPVAPTTFVMPKGKMKNK